MWSTSLNTLHSCRYSATLGLHPLWWHHPLERMLGDDKRSLWQSSCMSKHARWVFLLTISSSEFDQWGHCTSEKIIHNVNNVSIVLCPVALSTWELIILVFSYSSSFCMCQRPNVIFKFRSELINLDQNTSWKYLMKRVAVLVLLLWSLALRVDMFGLKIED